ncbi:Hypothetical protein AAM4_0849 [Actinomyces succiniciruminis]|uniref:Uncharacterized protein n=1 Tax=Actinomyces succiniciruminis TaxID=1522002 RepID=A0A1L7RA07_9ACTO|nr:Hypothetical protein AAM4_0849 [Actinomyces succiniciruminis]
MNAMSAVRRREHFGLDLRQQYFRQVREFTIAYMRKQ